jgi:uncharacterized membrane protein
MELIHSLHSGLGSIVSLIKFSLESISVLCVALGLLSSLMMAVKFAKNLIDFRENVPALRLQFGSWLALALEFQLGADIVSTTVNPTFQKLGELGLLALIRTFLNFFLQKEMQAEERLVKAVAEKEPANVGAASSAPTPRRNN